MKWYRFLVVFDIVWLVTGVLALVGHVIGQYQGVIPAWFTVFSIIWAFVSLRSDLRKLRRNDHAKEQY